MVAGSAGAQSPGVQIGAERETVGAIARARAVDGKLHSIIAIDPTAIAQAQSAEA